MATLKTNKKRSSHKRSTELGVKRLREGSGRILSNNRFGVSQVCISPYKYNNAQFLNAYSSFLLREVIAEEKALNNLLRIANRG